MPDEYETINERLHALGARLRAQGIDAEQFDREILPLTEHFLASQKPDRAAQCDRAWEQYQSAKRSEEPVVVGAALNALSQSATGWNFIDRLQSQMRDYRERHQVGPAPREEPLIAPVSHSSTALSIGPKEAIPLSEVLAEGLVDEMVAFKIYPNADMLETIRSELPSYRPIAGHADLQPLSVSVQPLVGSPRPDAAHSAPLRRGVRRA